MLSFILILIFCFCNPWKISTFLFILKSIFKSPRIGLSNCKQLLLLIGCTARIYILFLSTIFYHTLVCISLSVSSPYRLLKKMSKDKISHYSRLGYLLCLSLAMTSFQSTSVFYFENSTVQCNSGKINYYIN